MANVKNFGLVGVGSDVQYGKTGPRLKHTTGTFQFRNATDAGDAALTAAGITSSAGNVTLTTGNVVLSNSGSLVVGNAGSLSATAAGIYSLSGTGAILVPSGTAAEQPAAATYPGAFRYNTDTDRMEFSDGSAWNSVATGTSSVSSFSGGSTGLTPNTPTTGAIVLAGILNGASGGTGVNNGTDTITTAGNVDFGGAVTTAGALTLAGAFTTAGAFPVTLTATASTSLTLPVSGTLLVNTDIGTTVQAWDADLDAIAALASTGFAVRTAANTWAQRSITGTAGRVTVTNGDGVASSPTVDLATLTDDTTGSFVKITRDAYGRVQGTTAVVTADITSLVDATYVNVAGDSMSSAANLTFVGGGEVLGLPSTPSGATAATSKAYVDSVAAGLTWKTAVLNATTANVTLSGEQTIDGVLTSTSRILVKNQSTAADNGIYVTAAGAWTRSTDADSPAELDSAAVFVQQGTVNGDTGWVQTNTIVTVGVTAVTWSQFSGGATYVAGSGLDLTGNTFSVNVGAGITILPTDEVGIDVEAGKAVQLTGVLSASQLTFVLDGGAASGLEQSSAGLKISANGVTNAMILNDFITLDADTGASENVALGATMLFTGNAAQGVSTSVAATNTVTITVQNATTGAKGVASFDSANFSVTAGAVSLAAGGVDLTTDVTGILPVANGGTGANTLLDTAIVIGNGTSAVEATSALTYNSSTDVMTIGGATGVSITAAGGDVSITALDANSDIILTPTGTGAVVVGPSGAGLIQSDAAQPLSVVGTTILTLQSGTGDVVLALSGTTANKVTVSGPTAAQYATTLADEDLVNKYYVDTVAGSSTGDIKGISATFSLAATGTFNIGAVLPAGSTVLSVKANVTAADTGTGTLSVGVAGNVAAYMTTAENDTQTIGMYISETMVTNAGVQVIGTVAGTPAGAGSVTVFVTYQLA